MQPRVIVVLIAAVGIISAAAIIIKQAQEASALVIATVRLVIASSLLIPTSLVLRRDALSQLTMRDIAYALLSGVFLSLHFLTWISSLEYTSVASSVVLVATNPIFVGIGAVIFLNERIPRLLVIGIGVSLLGTGIIGADDFHQGGTSVLYGDLLAVMGAMTHSGYLLIGQRLRAKMDTLTYITLVYGSAAAVLLLGALATGASVSGLSSYTWLMMILLALGPQLLGHTAYNWSLKFVTATVVAVMILAEPIGAAVLAYVLLGEGVTLLKIAGGLVVLVGIYLSIRSTQNRPKPIVS